MPHNERSQHSNARNQQPPKKDIWVDPWWGARLREHHRKRRLATKRRVAAMSPGKRLARRFAVIGTWLLGAMAALLVASVVLFYALSDVPRPESLPLPQVATLLYSDGTPMARLGSTNRTIVSLDKVPDSVRWAVLAAEDRRFYKDPGVSVRGTLRAAVTNIRGGDTQGGSGITQQYAKNAYLSDARTLSRKLKELAIAVKLTREYTKDQILEFYLNTVYFGRGAYGIQAAAETYFGVGVSKLSTAQAAVLAALLRAPYYYDPANNRQAAVGRWHYVLDGMVATHHLDEAKAARLTYPKVRPPRDTNGLGANGPTFLIWQRVKAELQMHGITEAEVYARGMKIRTTIERPAQDAAIRAIRETFDGLTPQQRNMKNALVAVNPETGGVVAYYGGPNGDGYDGKPDYNDYAGVGSRPPGSSFKPYTLATVLNQTLKKAKGKPQLSISSRVDGSFCKDIAGTQICNDPSDRGFSGPSVRLADAMKYSLNTTFDLLAEQAGPDRVAATAHAMGIAKTDAFGRPTLKGKNGRTTFGIGIGDYPVAPIDQAVGFATLAAGGIRHDPYFVRSVKDSNGGYVYRHEDSGRRVIDAKVANDVTLTLQPIPAWSNDALADGRVAAAKTGTEGIPGTTDNSDAWMVGYTPQVSAAVWVGSGNSTTPIFNSYGGAEYGSDLPGKTWATFMNYYLDGKPQLPMATEQLIHVGGDAVRPSPKPSPTTRSTTSSPSPTPSSSPSTGLPTPPPPSTSVVVAPSPSVPSATLPPGVECSPVLLGTRCTTAAAPPPPPAPAG